MTTSGFSVQEKDNELGHAISKLPVAYELELHRAIELEAYLCAEKDCFRCPPLDYWLAAEANLYRYF